MELMSGETATFIQAALDVMATLFVFMVGLAVLAVIVIFILDVTQTRHAIRRNYPVIGRLRNCFERLGEFFRQYFFTMDREELPFNRAQHSRVYPNLGEDAVPTRAVTIGPECREPYTTETLFNISGMSYGAISKPAVLALSHGARMAGCWMNTGEGGLSPYHLDGGCDQLRHNDSDARQ